MIARSYVIVGAGESGVAAAHSIREADPMARIAVFSDEAGLPYERPPLSKGVLTDIGGSGPKYIRTREWFDEFKVDLFSSSSVDSIDVVRQTVSARQGEKTIEVAYDKLLLATGARARKFPALKGDCPVYYLRTLGDAVKLRERLLAAKAVLIVGGGVIGLEVASSARKLGKSVTVVELASRLMARAFTPELSERLLALHRDNGVDVRLDVGPIELSGVKGGVLCRAGGLEIVRADMALVGIGVIPNTMLAESVGCFIDNGVLVDGSGQTSIENIYAAGDVASFAHPIYDKTLRLETWRHAQRHGAHVGRSMVGEVEPYDELPWFWTDQHGVNIQVTGLVSGESETAWRCSGGGSSALHFEGEKFVGVTTINNGREMRPFSKLIAAHWRGRPEALLSGEVPLGKLCKQLISEINGDNQ